MGNFSKIFCIMILFLLPFVVGDQIVVNSQDWKDVYSGMIYANINNNKGSYIIDEGHGLLLQDELDSSVPTTVIESAERPFIRNYDANLQAKGFTTQEIQAGDNLNLELAGSLDVSSFIVLDERYSYNAVSIAPYAVRKKYYVLFADSENIDEIVEVLRSKDSPELIIYGYVDREVTAGLSEFSPTVINEGNKFSNNLEIIKLFLEEFETNQLILTNGEFLEPQFFIGSSPVLFIGKTNIPDETIEYLLESNIKHAILIGYDIFDNAVTLKNRVGLKVIVKFAKGIDSKQYALDIFQLPKETYSIGISSLTYNTFSKQLEVSYFNLGDIPAFIKGSHNILLKNNSILVVGDDEALFIGSEETLTATYDAELVQTEGLSARSNVLYGGDRRALEHLIIIEKPVEVIEYEDNSDVEISDAYYDKRTKRLNVRVRNTGGVTVYARTMAIDIIVNNREETLTSEIKELPSGKSEEFSIKARLTPEDILDNEMIKVGVRYGKRENALLHYKEKEFEFTSRYLSNAVIITGIVLLALVATIIIIMIFFRRRRGSIHEQKLKNRPAPPPKR